MAVLMPITSPRMFSSGPPLLPGLMAASVCRKCWNCWDRRSTSRSLALMMPAVTVAWKPNGEPMAMAQSPTCTASELPILAGTRLLLAFHANHRQVGGSIHAHHLGVVLGGIAGELHLDAVGLVDHVIVGQDVAGRVHHHAGAERLAPALRHVRLPLPNGSREEAVEEIVHAAVARRPGPRRRAASPAAPAVAGSGVALLGQISGGNIHHRGLYLLGNLGEGGGQFDGVGNHQRRRIRAPRCVALAAFTPELIRVPITMPIDSVNRINVNESNFWCATCQRYSWTLVLLL